MQRQLVARFAAALSPAVVIGAWSGWVLYDRQQKPDDVRFEVGSPDDMLADQLKTGDVLLFSRRWYQMMPCGAVLSIGKKCMTGSRFDHVGVIVNNRFGVPHVAELTYSGVKLRRFDERILWSRCDEILLLPVRFNISEEKRAEVERHVKGMELRATMNVTLLEVSGLVKSMIRSDDFVAERDIMEATGTSEDNAMVTADGKIPKPSEKITQSMYMDWVPVSPAVQMVMSCLDAAGAIDIEHVSKYKNPTMLTPKDFEDAAVPLEDGWEYGQALPVRIRD